VIAEQYSICELLRRGYEVVTSPDPRNKGWDIIVIKSPKPNNEKMFIKLQVKGVQWQVNTKTKPTITGEFSSNTDFDYLVIVVVNYSKTENYLLYVIPKPDLISTLGKNQKTGLLCDTTKKIRYTNNTIAFSTFKSCKPELDKKYKDNWIQIESMS
jgi:hypothetical protein